MRNITRKKKVEIGRAWESGGFKSIEELANHYGLTGEEADKIVVSARKKSEGEQSECD